ncbi:hypothetical protein HELRODRAFT_176494 [Helobdella robusta]|uniref:Uncharacterized protein n=1 Tax=Helobdella robusta TaxID=6412 RepID=T1FAK9_HELRO|nr:hypothetical protein HELRODRAFT_176494 [Helobdella robusta]ESN99734.1 hypothetical protein HELRODRAFT_176494 [Helobdella robusta]
MREVRKGQWFTVFDGRVPGGGGYLGSGHRPQLHHVKVRPDTWYNLKMTTHNNVGTKKCLLTLATPPDDQLEASVKEAKLKRHSYWLKRKNAPPFYARLEFMFPLIFIVAFSVVVVVLFLLYQRRRKLMRKMKTMMTDDREDGKDVEVFLSPVECLAFNMRVSSAGYDKVSRSYDDRKDDIHARYKLAGTQDTAAAFRSNDSCGSYSRSNFKASNKHLPDVKTTKKMEEKPKKSFKLFRLIHFRRKSKSSTLISASGDDKNGPSQKESRIYKGDPHKRIGPNNPQNDPHNKPITHEHQSSTLSKVEMKSVKLSKHKRRNTVYLCPGISTDQHLLEGSKCNNGNCCKSVGAQKSLLHSQSDQQLKWSNLRGSDKLTGCRRSRCAIHGSRNDGTGLECSLHDGRDDGDVIVDSYTDFVSTSFI